MDRKKAIEYIRWYFTEDDGMAADASVKEAIQTLVPELKESEDERIRKELVNFLQSPFIEENLTDEKVAPWIAYLEKQKEQTFTHHEINESLQDAVTHQMEDDGDVDDFVRRGIDDIVLKYAEIGAKWQKEQKPINWTELNGKDIAKLEVLINNVHNEYPNGIGQESFGEEVLERFREYKEDEDLDGKEQKPDENITDEEIKQAVDDIHNFKVAVTDLAKTFNIRIDHDRDIDWHNFCASLLTYLKRHAEWSEVDETGYMDLMWCIEQARKSAKDENDMGNVWYAEHWLKERLKSLLSRFE